MCEPSVSGVRIAVMASPKMSRLRASPLRTSPLQLAVLVAGGLVAFGLLVSALILFVVGGSPWGPCAASNPDCGPSRSSFIGASFVCATVGVLLIAALVSWRRRSRSRQSGMSDDD